MSATSPLPPDAPAAPPRRRRGCLTFAGCGALVFLLCGGCLQGIIAYAVPPFPTKGWVDAERKVPPKWEPRNPQPNGWDDLVAATSVGGLTEEQSALRERWTRAVAEGETPAESETEEIRAIVGSKREVLERIHAASGKQLESGKLPRVDTLFPEFAKARECARIAAMAALLAHEDGRDDDALAILDDLLTLGVSMDSGESMIQLLVGIAIAAIANRQAETVILNGNPSDEALRSYAEHMRALRERPSGLPRTFAYEAAGADDAVDVAKEVGLGALGDMGEVEALGHPAGKLYMRLKGEASREWLHDRHARLIEEAEKPRGERDLAAFSERAERDADERVEVLGKIILPVFSKVDDKCAQLDIYLTGQETMCALELYRRAHGSYPEQLVQLVPEYLPALPEDEFTQQPLLYRPEGTGYVLYSCGTDKKDDGAVAETRGALQPDMLLIGGTVLKKPTASTSGPAEAGAQPAAAGGWE